MRGSYVRIDDGDALLLRALSCLLTPGHEGDIEGDKSTDIVS